MPRDAITCSYGYYMIKRIAERTLNMPHLFAHSTFHAKRIMTKNLVRLSLSTFFVVGTFVFVGGAEPSAVDSNAAHSLAVEAFQAEVDGDFLSRQRLLAEALQADVNCPLLNAQLGKVAIASDDWRSVDECVQLATANNKLQQYYFTRGDRELEVFAQLGKGGDVANSDLEAICRILSLWLRSNGSLDLAMRQLDGIGSSMTVPTAPVAPTTARVGLLIGPSLRKRQPLAVRHPTRTRCEPR